MAGAHENAVAPPASCVLRIMSAQGTSLLAYMTDTCANHHFKMRAGTVLYQGKAASSGQYLQERIWTCEGRTRQSQTKTTKALPCPLPGGGSPPCLSFWWGLLPVLTPLFQGKPMAPSSLEAWRTVVPLLFLCLGNVPRLPHPSTELGWHTLRISIHFQ